MLDTFRVSLKMHYFQYLHSHSDEINVDDEVEEEMEELLEKAMEVEEEKEKEHVREEQEDVEKVELNVEIEEEEEKSLSEEDESAEPGHNEEIDSDVSREVHHKFAEYILVTAIPWPSPDCDDFYSAYGGNNVEKLLNIYTKLCNGTFLFDEESECFLGPPGYENLSIPLNSPAGRNYYFSQRNQAIFIANLAKGVKRTSAISRRLHLIWRSRNTQKWSHSDPEKDLRKDNPSSYIFDEQRQSNSFAGHPDDDDEEEGDKNKREEKLLKEFLDNLIKTKKMTEHEHIEGTVVKRTGIYRHLFDAFLRVETSFKAASTNRMQEDCSTAGETGEIWFLVYKPFNSVYSGIPKGKKIVNVSNHKNFELYD